MLGNVTVYRMACTKYIFYIISRNIIWSDDTLSGNREVDQNRPGSATQHNGQERTHRGVLQRLYTVTCGVSLHVNL